MNTNVTSGNFSSEDVDFTLRFPGIIKKKKNMYAAGRRTFSVASHLKTRIHIIPPRKLDFTVLPLARKYIYSFVVCHVSRAELFISKAPNCNFAEL